MGQTVENEDYLKVKWINTSKEFYIIFIKSIWLEGVDFVLPKRLSSRKIVYTICLFNKDNFPITHTVMFVILKVSMKWLLFDSVPFNKAPKSWLVIVESRSKVFSATCLLFWAFFVWKKCTTLLQQQFKLSGLMQYCLWVLKDLNVSVVTECLHILHLISSHNLQQPFFFSRGATFTLKRLLSKF